MHLKDAKARKKVSYAAVTAIISLCQFIYATDYTAVNVALASIGRDFHVLPASLSWVITAFLLTFGGFLIFGGKLGDIYGRRGVCIVGLCCFSVGTVFAYMSISFPMLVIARALEGFGTALVIPTSFSLINVALPEGSVRNRAFSLFSIAQGVAAFAGLGLGGLLTTHFGWRSIFLFNLPFLALSILLAYKYIPHQVVAKQGRIDIGGVILLTISIALTLYFLLEFGRLGIHSIKLWLILAMAAAAVICFVLLESRLKEPLLSLSILKFPNFAGADLASMAGMAALGGLLVLFNLFMQRVMHFSAMASGLGMTPYAVAVVVTGHLLKHTMARFLLRNTILVGLVILMLSPLLAATTALSPSYAVLAVSMALLGAGAALSCFVLMAFGTEMVTSNSQGVASGLLMTCQHIGLALGVSATLTILNNATAEQLSSGAAFVPAFFSCAVMVAVSFVVVIALTRSKGMSLASA